PSFPTRRSSDLGSGLAREGSWVDDHSCGPPPGTGGGPAYREVVAVAAVMNLTDAEFDQKVLKSETPVVVDFWAPWCGPCRRLAPILEEVAAEMGDRLQVYKLNTDENPQSPGRYGVMSIPTLIVFRNGQEVDRIVGALPKEILREKLEAAIS